MKSQISNLLLLPLLALLPACSRPVVADPLTQRFGGNAPEAQLNFWHELALRPLASNDEAFHALLLYTDGADPAADYAARVTALRSRSLIPAGFDRPAAEAVERGTLAVAVARILQVRGGLMLHVAPTSPRYATRELVYRGIYPPSSPHQPFSGAELVGVIGKLEDVQRGNPNTAPAALLPDEANPRP